MLVDRYAAHLRLGRSKRGHLGHNRIQVDWLQVNLNRPREVEERLNDSIKPFDFGVEYFKLRARVRITRLELGTKDLEMDHHRIERVLDLVCDARCDAPEIREFLRQIPLRLEFLERFVVPHADQCAHRLACVLDVLNRRQKLSRTWFPWKVEGCSCDRPSLIESAFDCRNQGMVGAQRLVNRKPAELNTVEPQYLLGVGAGKNYAAFTVYQKQTLFQMTYYLPQSASHYFQLASLAGESLAQLPQSRSNASHHLVTRQIADRSGFVRTSQPIDAGRYCFQWPQEQVRRADRYDCSADDRHQPDNQVRCDRAEQLTPNGRSGHADVT